jgi:hypothetical protein
MTTNAIKFGYELLASAKVSVQQTDAGQKLAWLGTIGPTGASNTLQHHS